MKKFLLTGLLLAIAHTLSAAPAAILRNEFTTNTPPNAPTSGQVATFNGSVVNWSNPPAGQTGNFQPASLNLSNWSGIDTNAFYPRSNPSNFVTASITNPIAAQINASQVWTNVPQSDPLLNFQGIIPVDHTFQSSLYVDNAPYDTTMMLGNVSGAASALFSGGVFFRAEATTEGVSSGNFTTAGPGPNSATIALFTSSDSPVLAMKNSNDTVLVMCDPNLLNGGVPYHFQTGPLVGPSDTLFSIGNQSTDLFALLGNGDLMWGANATIGWRPPATNSAAGQVLTSDGGTPQQLYWTTPSAGAAQVWTNDSGVIKNVATATNIDLVNANSSVVLEANNSGNTVASGVSSSQILGGNGNHINIGDFSSIFGGDGNVIDTNASEAIIVGGHNNRAMNTYSIVIGGTGNHADGDDCVIASGSANDIGANVGWASILAGDTCKINCTAGSDYFTILSGLNCQIVTTNATGSAAGFSYILGGTGNTTKQGNTWIIGNNVQNDTGGGSIELGFSNTKKMRVDPNNLVLVGTMQLKATNNAAAGLVLTSDSSGNAAWSNVVSSIAGGTNINVTTSGTVPTVSLQGSISNIIQMSWTTNNNPVVPDMTLGYQLFSTNASFQFLSPVGVDAAKKSVQSSAVYVTNSSGSTITVTAPANVHTVGTMNVTNGGLTRFTFEIYGGAFSNVFAVPVF